MTQNPPHIALVSISFPYFFLLVITHYNTASPHGSIRKLRSFREPWGQKPLKRHKFTFFSANEQNIFKITLKKHHPSHSKSSRPYHKGTGGRKQINDSIKINLALPMNKYLLSVDYIYAIVLDAGHFLSHHVIDATCFVAIGMDACNTCGLAQMKLVSTRC